MGGRRPPPPPEHSSPQQVADVMRGRLPVMLLLRHGRPLQGAEGAEGVAQL